MREKVKVNVLSLSPDDVVIITVGSLEHNILPTQKDLNDWKRYFQRVFGRKTRILALPPTYKLEVIRK